MIISTFVSPSECFEAVMKAPKCTAIQMKIAYEKVFLLEDSHFKMSQPESAF